MASKDATLKWTGTSGEEEVDVWRQSATAKEVTISGSKIPSAYTVRAYEKGTSKALMLNGMESVDVPFSLVKQTTLVQITDGMLMRFLAC